MTETYRVLVNDHGVLMTYESLSQVLQRSPDGLRLSLARGGPDWVQKINAARVRIGRRVLFRTQDIADLIDGNKAASEQPPVVSGGASQALRRSRGRSAA
jgi:hypothetical protein